MEARVKPLVWEESLKDRWIGTPDSKLGDLAFWIFRHHDGTLKHATKEGWQFYPTLDAAKAAAQADYEARILAALEPAPDMAELVEALRMADAALSGANMNMAAVEKKVKAALATVSKTHQIKEQTK